MGYIKRGVIEKLTLDIMQNELPHFTLNSAKATVDLSRNKTTLKNVTLTHHLSKKQIHTKTAYWDKQQKAFVIPGNYTAQTPKGRASGKGISDCPQNCC